MEGPPGRHLRDGLPSYEDLKQRTDRPAGSSWGVFGEDDHLGTLNFLTPERVVAATRLAKRGVVFNLDYPLDAFTPPPVSTRSVPRHHIFQTNPNHRDDWLDGVYLQGTSQIDGLRHIRHPEHGFYGGVADTEVAVGQPALGIQEVAEHGIVGRGVLLDVARQRQADGPAPAGSAWSISPADLDRTADRQGVAVEAGDVVLVRTGWAGEFMARSTDERWRRAFGREPSPGLHQSEATLAWLWDHRVALVAADNVAVEAFPVDPDSGLVDPDETAVEEGGNHNGMLHRPWIALLGLFLGELWRLDDLAADCAEDGVYEFLVTAKVLNLVGGVGSPANAMAVK